MLQGTLDTLSLPELFTLLSSTGKSGALHVRGTRGLGIVYFAGGYVCAAEAGERSGPVDTLEGVTARLHDVCFELFRYDSGTFEFEPTEPPHWPVLAEARIESLVGEAMRRMEEWEEIERVIPSIEARPLLVAEPPVERVSLDRDEWRIITGISGRRRVSAIMRLLDLSEFDVCRQLKRLVDSGLVEIELATDDEPADAPASGQFVAGTAPARGKRRAASAAAPAASDEADDPADAAGAALAAAAELSALAHDGEDEVLDKKALVKFLSTVQDA